MNNRLNIQDLAGLLSEYTGKDKGEVEQFLKCFISVVAEGVYSDKLVKIKGLGTFKIITVEKRESIDVNTGARILIPAHYKFSFLPDKDLREQVNKPFSAFETTEIQENVTFDDMEESVEDSEKTKETEDESVEEVMPEREIQKAVVIPVEKPKEETPVESVPEEIPSADPVAEKTPLADPIPEPETPVIEPETPAIEPETLPEPEREQPVQAASELIAEETPLEKEPQRTQEPPKMEEPPKAQEPSMVQTPPTAPELIPTPEVSKPQKKSRLGLFMVCLLLVMAIIAVGCFTLGRYYCFPDPVVVNMDPIATPVPAEPQADTLVKPETANQADTIREHPEKPNRDSLLTKVPLTDPMPPKPLAKVEIKRGDRLTVIALKYYGHKLFWVYIYKHNKAVISDPNNVPIGTVIDIPIPEMYGIDAKSSSSREKAAALQTEILSGQ